MVVGLDGLSFRTSNGFLVDEVCAELNRKERLANVPMEPCDQSGQRGNQA